MFDDDDLGNCFDGGIDDGCSDDCTDCFDTNSLSAECMWHDPMGTFSSDTDE